MSTDVKLDQHKIQTLRLSKCWSQEELASASGLSVRTIQRLEKTGTASLETTKALAAVFELTPYQLQVSTKIKHRAVKYIFNYSWLVAFVFAFSFFGLWIVDILIPTLKGADFNTQYQIHGDFRYLDFGGLSLILGFVIITLNIVIEHLSIRRVLNKSS